MSFDLLSMVYAELISEEKIAESLADIEFQAQKNHLCNLINAKAGLEHRYYPYDLKGLKLTKLGMIPSLIPSVPTGDNRTKSILILFAYTNFDFIYIINTYIASSRI